MDGTEGGTGNARRARQGRYRQIAEALREAIAAGTFGPGQRLPTEVDLAREHGVSRFTAALALNELARAGLVSRSPRRGTIVRPTEQHASRPSHPLIAFISPHVEPTFTLHVLRGMQRQALEAGFRLLLSASGNTLEEEAAALRDAVDAGAAGVMVFLHDEETYNGEVLRLVVGGYPIVLVDRYLNGVPCANVSSENLAGSRLAVQELLHAGHSRICLLSCFVNTSPAADRSQGYVLAHTEAGIPVDFSLQYVVRDIPVLPPDWDLPSSLVERFAGFLEDHPNVTAVYATNAMMGLLALQAFDQLRLRCPDDVSLVCIDPVEAIPQIVRPVTAVLQQSEAIGTTAVTLMEELLAGQPSRSVLLPMHLRQAGSVGPPAPRRQSHQAILPR
jgi:GntR family transcriptional regulator of arabinose operon